MKTRIARTHRNRCIELLIDDGSKGDGRQVLAAMTHFEGTRHWMLTDIRLHRTRMPSAYSGGLIAEDIHTRYIPESADEAAFVRSQLREYWEDDSGIHWSTCEGLVRGKPVTDSMWLSAKNHIGCSSLQEGLAYLEAAQQWWAQYEGSLEDAKLPNPHRQPSWGHVFGLVHLRQAKQSAKPPSKSSPL